MNRDATTIFADIDSFDVERFVAHLTPDVTFRFGNAEPIHGKDAVREAVLGFWSTIDGLTHHLVKVVESGDTMVAKINVEYLRKDGKSVTVPNADILEFDGDLVRDWQIYIDLAPVFA
ncbi:MAG: nuclear transport factor 2 family protein [Streptosporangiaceae bacterium]|jgi:ketosteroid isomerase-like protein